MQRYMANQVRRCTLVIDLSDAPRGSVGSEPFFACTDLWALGSFSLLTGNA